MTEKNEHSSNAAYLDGDGLTPLRPGVKEAIIAGLSNLANPNARYEKGRQAQQALESCREEIATMIGASPEEIFLTSSASESNTWAIMGASLGKDRPFSGLFTGSTDHVSVISAMNARSQQDLVPLTALRPQNWSTNLVSGQNQKNLGPLASFAWADAEVGLLSPIGSISHDVRHAGGIFHVDFVAAQKTERIRVSDFPIDMMTLSSSSMGGPPGIAALYVRKGVRISPLIFGGVQENGKRGGLIPVFLAEGWKAAIHHWNTHVDDEKKRLSELTRTLSLWFRQSIQNGLLVCPDEPRLPGIVNMLIPGIDGQAAVSKLDAAGIQTGTGSSCSSQSLKVSHVLRALGVSSLQGQGSIVITFPWNASLSHIHQFQHHFPSVLDELLSLSPKNIVSRRKG